MFKFLMAIFMLLAFAVTPLSASVGTKNNDTYLGEATTVDFQGYPDRVHDGTTTTVYGWGWTGTAQQVPLSLLSFANVAYSTTDVGRTGGGSPYRVNIPGGADYIVFPASLNNASTSVSQAGSPIEYTFRIPDSYRTTPSFRVMCANSLSRGTANYIDWDIVINRSGSAVSTTRYNQTPVGLTASTAAMQSVTLTYATPGDIVAGDIVTLRLWRVYEAVQTSTGRDATSDLRVYDVAFRYLASW